MDGVPAVYLGRIVSKENFRTFVYATDGSKKLVESWAEYERHMESGVWFSMKEDAMARIPVEKPKRSRPQEPKKEDVKKDDDFLPKDD